MLAVQIRLGDPLKYFGCSGTRASEAQRLASLTAAAETAKTTAAKKELTAAAAAAARPAARDGPPRFASLELSVLDPHRDLDGGDGGDGGTPFAANSRAPIPLESEFFSGHVLLLLRPETLEPADDRRYASHFEATGMRPFEMQVQGRFRQLPRGALYLGGEVGG